MTASIRRVAALLGIVTSPSMLGAESRPDYRTYRMGDALLTISRQIGLLSPATSAPHVVSPVLEVTWRARHVRRGGTPSSDPVALLLFSFYDDQLFRIVIDYAPRQTEGMTEADMVAAVSKLYGVPEKRTDPPSPVGSNPIDSVVAQWTDGELQVALLAVRGRTAFRMIVWSAPLEMLARAAGAEEKPTDPQDWTSIDAGSPNAGIERAGSSWEERRRANIASFIP